MDKKQEYALLLQSPEWKSKRNEILKRDFYKCVKCRNTNTLQVHHKKYIKGKMPWDVSNKYLITLCRDCHFKEHENKCISSFAKSHTKQKNDGLSKNQRRLKRMYASLTPKERELQERRDKIKKRLY